MAKLTTIQAGDLLVYPWKNGRPGHIALVAISSNGPNTAGDVAVSRALQWVGKGIYGLGKGGLKPGRIGPLDKDGKCDCSGFVTWAWGIPRYDGENWHNTSFIYADAKGKQKFYQIVEPDVDFAKLDIAHCHGPSPSARRPNPPPAISKGTGLLWKKKNGIVCRPRLTNS